MTASATGSVTTSAIGEWVSVTQASKLCKVSARTVHRWIATEEVEAERTPEGYRRIRASLLPTVSEGVTDSVADTDSEFTAGVADSVCDVSESVPLNSPRHGLSEGAATGEVPQLGNHYGDSTVIASLQRERDQALADVTFLRSQLEQRAEEIQRRDQAEAELRRLLLVAQQSLQAAMERPMLPPAMEVKETPRRVRWWLPWRR